MIDRVANAIIDMARAMLADIPPADATVEQRANFQLYKAEVCDLLSIVAEPAQSQIARDLASTARYEAHKITADF
ncbi:hypothetical protein ACFWY9_35770 [Amycolatopsis sp. NPDC059027]|uniref:hypothetical protein n=1 Tax=Amycolatopsis sp. NPDC059027 TaxID=3346709 RepID=UPI00366E66EF